MKLFNKNKRNKKQSYLINDIEDNYICQEFIQQLWDISQEEEVFVFDKHFYDYIEELILSEKYIKYLTLIKLSCILELDALDRCDVRTTSIQQTTLFVAVLAFISNFPDNILKIICIIYCLLKFYSSLDDNDNANNFYEVINTTLKCIEQLQKEHALKIANYEREVV